MYLFIYSSCSKMDENIYRVKKKMLWHEILLHQDVCSMLSFPKLFCYVLVPNLLPLSYFVF